jgi:cobalt-zinc-cadmium efflux system outer membrane protein
MQLTPALLALALASSAGAITLADDGPQPPPASKAPDRPAPRGLFGRFRKPRGPEVPPMPPRTGPAPTPSPIPLPTESTRTPAGPRLEPGPLPTIPTAAIPGPESPVRRTQATPADMGMPIGPGTDSTAPLPGGQSISLQQALTGALTSNPDLVALRQGNPAQASAEAVEVARHFPVALNPTVFIDYRPITLIPRDTFATATPGIKTGPFYHYGQNYLLVALRQPIEWGHQTTHRYGIAKAAYKQVQWQVVQAELTALVQTYRFFQTAAYRREKLRVAEQLADFNESLLATLDRRLKSGQGLPADVALAKVESRATRQQAKAAKQDYVTALTDLRNQIGIPESAAESEPLGEFTLPGNIPPVDEQAMVQAALSSRPDLQATQAAIEGAASAVKLARGDAIPTTIFGPQYVQDEAGIQYVGFNLVPTLPILNSGKPLIRQREAEQRRAVVTYQQAQQRAVSQVRAAVAKWNGATILVNDSSGLTQELTGEVASLERLFEAGQTDLTRVQQARQRLIQLENAQLDALWAATQAQADLMLAVGVPSMIQALLQVAEADAGVAPGTPPASTAPAASGPPMPPTPSPFSPTTR